MLNIKHIFVSACFNAGISVSKQSDPNAVHALIERLRPVLTNFPLIRVGPDFDGGYLIPDDLDDVAACFSPGVDVTALFESDMIRRGIPCFLADASIVDAPIADTHFTKKFIGPFSDDSTITLDDWVKTNKPGNDDLILQADIEGAEWQMLLNVSPETLRRFRIMAIEFHDLERLMDKHAFAIINAVFNRLCQDFHIVHNHPNNTGGYVSYRSLEIPRVQEITFLRKDRSPMFGFAGEFPHRLDRPNDLRLPDFALPRSWWGGL